SSLNPETNYINAPQAPSKYDLKPDAKHVGASWLTREDTIAETKNILSYVDAVWEAENITNSSSLIVLGYSQGVSIATRWIASRKIQCKQLVLHSGGIPKELKPENFIYMAASTKVLFMYGDQDPYISPSRLVEEAEKGAKLFGNKLDVRSFKGAHEVNIEFLQNILQFQK
ncbi:MAG: esterase, partial [Flavobacterium sp.]